MMAVHTPSKQRLPLGALDVNTSGTPSGTPRKAVEGVKSEMAANWVRQLTPGVEGQDIAVKGVKRPFEEVDAGVEGAGEKKAKADAANDADADVIVESAADESPEMEVDELAPVDGDIEAEDAPSSDTVSTDPILETTTAVAPPLVNDSQRSFASLINYSQATETGGMTNSEECGPDGVQAAVTEDKVSPQETPSISHAETLRLRLRVAMFKVRTGQTGVPFDQLKISPKKASSGTLLPSPFIDELNQSSSQDDLPGIPPSSPPMNDAITSLRSMHRTPVNRLRFGTGEGSDNEDGEDDITGHEKYLRRRYSYGGVGEDEDIDLTSSVVKGRAANGLLELMGMRDC